MSRVKAATVPEPPREKMFSTARLQGQHFFLSGMHAGGSGGIVGGSDTYLQSRETSPGSKNLQKHAGAQ